MSDSSSPAPVGPPAPYAPQIRRYTDNAKAANTRKAYRIDWDDFVGWCALHGCVSIPATPETVAEYLVHLADAGATVATLQRRCSSISVAHQVRGHARENPARSGLVTTTLQGIRRTLGTAQVQKTPPVTPDLSRLVAACAQLLSHLFRKGLPRAPGCGKRMPALLPGWAPKRTSMPDEETPTLDNPRSSRPCSPWPSRPSDGSVPVVRPVSACAQR